MPVAGRQVLINGRWVTRTVNGFPWLELGYQLSRAYPYARYAFAGYQTYRGGRYIYKKYKQRRRNG